MPKRPPRFKPYTKMGNKILQDRSRPSPSKRGYDAHWARWRNWFLNMVAVEDSDAQFDWQKYRSLSCEKCGAVGDLELDHIIPIGKGGPKYDPENIQILCKSCHSKKTVAQDGGLGHG